MWYQNHFLSEEIKYRNKPDIDPPLATAHPYLSKPENPQ